MNLHYKHEFDTSKPSLATIFNKILTFETHADFETVGKINDNLMVNS